MFKFLFHHHHLKNESAKILLNRKKKQDSFFSLMIRVDINLTKVFNINHFHFQKFRKFLKNYKQLLRNATLPELVCPLECYKFFNEIQKARENFV